MRIQSRFLLSLGLTAVCGITACSKDSDDGDDVVPMGVKIDSFTSDKTMVASGATVVLSYSVSNATSVSISASPGGALLTESTTFAGNVTSAAITETTVFTLTAAGTGGPKMASVTVTVDANAVEVLTFTADPNPAPAFADVELSWTTAGATQVRLVDDQDTELLNTTTDVASGSFIVELDDVTHTYRLIAINAAGMDMESVTVTIAEVGRINFFRASPSIFTGASAAITVVWNAEGDEFALTANGSAVPEFTGTKTGTITVNVTGNTLFELTATGAGLTDRALAAVGQGVPESEPNNDTATADPITGGATGSIMPMTDIDFYSFTVQAGGNVFAETSDGMGGCMLDTVIRLYDSAGMELGSNDQSGPGDCSQIAPEFDTFARDLAAGTYYLSVESWQQGLEGSYALVLITGVGECGNNLLELSLGEQCDDGNAAAGDGCTATCQVELLGTVTGLNQDQSFDGAIDPASQIDYYQVTMDGPGFIFAETGSPMIGQCAEGVDTVVALFDSTFTQLGQNDDIDFFGGNLCSRIDPAFDAFAEVMPGTYYLGVRSLGGTDPIADYQLQVRTIAPGCGNSIVELPDEQCDDGGTATGDGCNATCMIETFGTINPPGGMVTVPATGDPMALPSFIEVVIATPGQSITATTTDGQGNCPFPTALGLFTSDLQRVGVTFGNGGCAFINPADANAGHSWAANLAAGSYLLGVIAENETDMGNVVVQVNINAAACGNRLTETRANEQCDDGNTANGDGCNSTCRFEGNIMVETEPNNDMGSADTSGAALNMTVTMNGSIDPVADQDWWAVTVPAGATLIARTYPIFGDPTSCDFDMDTRIFLLNSTGMQLAFNDDDDARTGFCSAIDGSTVDMGAANLAAGTYYIRVQHYDDTAAFPTYFMDIRLQ